MDVSYLYVIIGYAFGYGLPVGYKLLVGYGYGKTRRVNFSLSGYYPSATQGEEAGT